MASLPLTTAARTCSSTSRRSAAAATGRFPRAPRSSSSRGRARRASRPSASFPSASEGSAVSVKEEKIEIEGEITEALRNGMFRVTLDNGHDTIGYIAGKMRRYRIRVFPGDRVKIELSPYDLARGRIVYRYR